MYATANRNAFRPPEGWGVAPNRTAADPIAQWDAEIKARIDAGMTKPAAIRQLVKAEPDLHKAYIEAYNARERGG